MKYRLLEMKVNKFTFVNNVKNGNKYNLQPLFGKKVKKITDETYELILSFSLHDADDRISPYQIELDMSGIFELKNGNPTEIKEFMDVNAVNMVFPYLRGVLSTAMSSMMVTPITLPIIDAKSFLKN